jgi:hypothetical protein
MTTKEKRIPWPKPRSAAQLRKMTVRQTWALAQKLHECWAEKHRRDMEWDLYWVQAYRDLLSGKKKVGR